MQREAQNAPWKPGELELCKWAGTALETLVQTMDTRQPPTMEWRGPCQAVSSGVKGLHIQRKLVPQDNLELNARG